MQLKQHIDEQNHKFRIPECDLVARYRNTEATEDLVIPITLVCNTPDEILVKNVRANSSVLERKWLGHSPEKTAPVVICGSGPSLHDSLGVIDSMHRDGATVIALNGAASYLASKGIWADYQVIVDARGITAALVGPARNHLFASQVDPSLFVHTPDAVLFHVCFCKDQEEFLDLLPGHDGEYALVGSHGSVGNVALGVAYALGFRDIHCFGYDSSCEGGSSHVFDQQHINAGEPMATINYNGKTYIASYTMKSQADVFPRVAFDLEQLGCTVAVHGRGLLPDRWNNERSKTLEQREEDKYKAMWGHADYRKHSTGHNSVEKAVRALQIQVGDTLIDFGCGTARATKAFIDGGVRAVGIDIAENALEQDVPFHKGFLWDIPQDMKAKFGYCCDVMEHIPTEKVDEVLSNISRAVEAGAFFVIDSAPDECGVLIGAPLHLTVRPQEWWNDKLKSHFSWVGSDEPSVFVCFK